MHASRTLPALWLALLCAPASGQLNDQWIQFVPAIGNLGPAPSTLSNSSTDVSFAWGDLDADGDQDVVLARKAPYYQLSKRTNVLLRNESGVLVDSSALASASDVPGDQGFLTPTLDWDAAFSDVDLDGDLDVVTATSTTPGDSKEEAHPRIYVNQGGIGAAWLGLRFESARSPQLFQLDSGLPQNPRFTDVSSGDLTGDGFPELYFTDRDSSVAGGELEPLAEDVDDRLWVNDGAGFFADQTQTLLPVDVYDTRNAYAAHILDVNADGANDLAKSSTSNPPWGYGVIYNDPLSLGTLGPYDKVDEPWVYMSMGDVNNDTYPDFVLSAWGPDMIRLNLGPTPSGQIVIGPELEFDLIVDDLGGLAISGKSLLADLDMDGWNEVLVCDVESDLSGCSRYLRIYHNETEVVGAQTNADLILQHEREVAQGPGWLGVPGMLYNHLSGTQDVAPFDFDGDGDLDLLIGRCSGTFLWRNELIPPCGLTSYGPTTGANVATLSSSDTPSAGQDFDFELSGFQGNGSAVLLISIAESALPLFGGTVVVDITKTLSLNVPITNGSGTLTQPLPAGVAGAQIYTQAAMVDLGQPAGLALSQGLKLTVCP